MNKFAKGMLTVDGDNLHMSMPFSKVNKAKRTVSGYATLDNVDTQGDVVLAKASAEAFKRARGNLREMHKKDSAVGRVVSFKEQSVFDSDGNEYNGIYVTARVSEGAQDTWLKVLDGTLSGFSIGGEINDATNEFNKDAGTTVRIIKDYDLTELSLVDNPANQMANVDSFEKNVFHMNKAADGSVKSITGMVAETEIENVFICKTDDTVIVKSDDEADCPLCSERMVNAGWFENGSDRTEKVRGIITKFLSPSDKEAATNNADSEGGEDMGTKKDQPSTPVPPTEEPAEVPAAEPVEGEPEGTNEEASADVDETKDTEPTDATATVEEVTDDETEISKKITELHDAVKESLDKSRTETKETVASLEEKISDLSDAFTKKASELDERINEFGQKLEVAKGRLVDFEKNLDAMNSSDAFRKSADLDDESAETITKSNGLPWTQGTFSHTSLFR